jgi:hypothetical protein
MTITNIIIIIILILLIFLNIYLINKEHFVQTSQSADNCAFNPKVLDIKSKSQCFEKCLESPGCINKQSCIGICNSFVPLNALKCKPTYEELKSNTKNQCIQQCKDLELLGCNYYKFNENGKSKLKPYSLKFVSECSNDLSELLSNPNQNCNPCIQQCNECPKDLCPFNERSNSDSSGQLNQCNLTNPIDLNKKFYTEQFIIQGIPEDNKITLYWNVVSLQDIKEFKIIITNKTNNNNISFMGSLEAEEKDIKNIGGCEQTRDGYRCAFIKDGLINDNSYNVVVNAISESSSGQQPNIKISNTINIVPRKINYINYELNDESCGKFETYKKTSIFNDLLGKTLEFNL